MLPHSHLSRVKYAINDIISKRNIVLHALANLIRTYQFFLASGFIAESCARNQFTHIKRIVLRDHSAVPFRLFLRLNFTNRHRVIKLYFGPSSRIFYIHSPFHSEFNPRMCVFRFFVRNSPSWEGRPRRRPNYYYYVTG